MNYTMTSPASGYLPFTIPAITSAQFGLQVLRMTLQQHGVRYSELQGIIEDIDHGFPATTDDGYVFAKAGV